MGRGRTQESLIHAQRLDAVGRLAGGVAHDFNNLISVINGYCQLLATREGISPEVLRDVEEIHKAGQKAAALTRQLLAFGRRQPLCLQPLGLNQLVQENAGILGRLLDGAGSLELALGADSVWVNGDVDQLQQVLLNLVLNARDALRDNGRVTIGTASRDVPSGSDAAKRGVRPGKYGVLTISDNGTGMDATTQDHLFEPFYTTKEPGKGSGLGLAMVYGVVQQSGGHILVESAVLVGTTFHIFLPLTAPRSLHPNNGTPKPLPPPTVQEGPVPLLTGLASRGGKSTVLLIEEDLMVSKMSSGMLASDGYHVIAAENTRQALRLLKKHEGAVHVLVASNGRQSECDQLLTALAKQASPVRVLCTMGCGENCLCAVKGLPCHGRLPKPYAMSELLQAVRKLVEMPLSKT